jgi:hypothetical protein
MDVLSHKPMPQQGLESHGRRHMSVEVYVLRINLVTYKKSKSILYPTLYSIVIILPITLYMFLSFTMHRLRGV